ncbi:MAG: hypothetical protein SGILL_004217 [Bacillariaceae sp.]
MVAVNITDAAAEVMVQAIQRWKKWRQDVLSTSLDRYSSSELPLSSKGPETGPPLDIAPNEVQRAAAQQAAQAALVFAQKRGAETSKNSQSSKPFIFRNRTGMSVAFVQQGKGLRDRGFSRRRMLESTRRSENDTAIGEYEGLERYEQQAITELADQEDAKFDIDLIEADSNSGSIMGRSVRHFNNKVRSYEGRYPDLTVAIQAVAGVTIEPLADLQVFKVGSTIRYLSVKKISATGTAIHSIRVVWNVEIEDNRRILTLSTAVRLVSSGLGIPIEVGVRKSIPRNGKDGLRSLSQSSIGFEVEVGSQPTSQSTPDKNVISIGFASSKNPLYMPLWLALRLVPVSICIRPASTTLSDYDWSEEGVLQFGPADQDDSQAVHPTLARWTWEETFQELSFVRCDPENMKNNPVWFSVFGSTSLAADGNSSKQGSERKKRESLKRRDESDFSDVLSITLDSCLTIRNMLPLHIDWEVSCSPKRDTKYGILESFSATLTSRCDEISKIEPLRSGESTEVLECCHNSSDFQARFRKDDGEDWSTWAQLKLDDSRDIDDDIDANDPSAVFDAFLRSRQVNVEIADKSLGIPTVLGVRILPKMTSDNPTRGRVYGLEIIVYAELWIRNITSLPLNFGCPAHQIHHSVPASEKPGSSFDESVAKFTAESALMEIANLLEVGDKGTGLNQSIARKIAESGTIETLPDQAADLLVEEVFEYVEINSSMVRRRCRSNRKNDDLATKIQAFHHPINDSFSRNQKRLRQKGKKAQSLDITKVEKESDAQTRISVKCGDGHWSAPLVVPDNGTSYGVIEAMASRWPQVTKTRGIEPSRSLTVKKKGKPKEDAPQQYVFKEACLDPKLHELCYVVSDVPGEWGDFSRTIEVSPRFVLRNDSKEYCLQIKQVGAPDATRLDLMPGQASPFYWADFRLPRLVSVKPAAISTGEEISYRWSGGFDLGSLGMTPVRIRNDNRATDGVVMSIRSLVEVRPGTGGMGMNISLREENTSGEGSLFRIENLTPFPIWLEQDGMLANPTSKDHHAGSPSIDGDLVAPHAKLTFALDIPYRQGKYASRKEASLSELLQVRVALAPLSSRAGVQMVKVIGLTVVGETARMNPSQLPLGLTPERWQSLRPMRVLGVVASDGPTRVLRFW